MRTYLTRLTFCAAGVVLTGVGMTAAAHATEDGVRITDDPIYTDTPAYIDGPMTLQPIGEEDDGPPLVQFDPDLFDLGSVNDDDETPDPGDDEPEDPSDDNPEDPSDEPADEPNEPTDEPADQPVETGSGGQGEPSGTAGDGSGDTSSDTSQDSASEDTADEPTPESDEATVVPAAQETRADGTGNVMRLLGVIAIALGSLGLAIVGYGFGRRPQPARNRRR